MRYAMLIYGTESAANASQDEMASYAAFGRELSERGILLSDEALHPAYSATTVRVREGKVLTADGPFAETKEQLGGFYLLDCRDLDEAIELASRNPGARTGSVEIRPILEWR
ncbi:MAG TPA: YciI family protein [Ktedonobacteraceae bacterium]|nr:YciI family protein [Ktedonobacteraceae bacterium]